MSKYFKINGYWKDNKESFEDYIVKEFDDVEEDEERDNLIFFYGLSENNLKEAVEIGKETLQEFVITSFEECNF